MRQARRTLPISWPMLAVAWAAVGIGADPDPAVRAWSTGGASATATPDDPDGKPAAVAGSAQTSPPYWQAPALPSAVIQGGAIPAGWQPQAVPYQGVGPDGRPMTMYFAPTYVFTYQAGPPVLAAPQPVERRRSGRIVRPGLAPNPTPASWNYATSGATPVAPVLPQGTVARYAPQPYRFPSDARALSGTPITPPAATMPPPPPQVWGAAPATTAAPASPWTQPPTGWSAASPVATPPPPAWPQGFVPPPSGFVPQQAAAVPGVPAGPTAPPTMWVAAPPSQVSAGAPWGVPTSPTPVANAAAAPSPPPPTASLPPPVPPIPAVPPAAPQPIPAS